MTIPIAAFKKSSHIQHHTETDIEMTVEHVSSDGDKDETRNKLEPLLTSRWDSAEDEQCVECV